MVKAGEREQGAGEGGQETWGVEREEGGLAIGTTRDGVGNGPGGSGSEHRAARLAKRAAARAAANEGFMRDEGRMGRLGLGCGHGRDKDSSASESRG